MELKIMSPQENVIAQEIKWNNEELKNEIAAKMADYESLVFTEETIKDAKKDRAALNKLRNLLRKECSMIEASMEYGFPEKELYIRISIRMSM